MAIIAISRQMGSGGYTIAAAVARHLKYDYVDRQMIIDAAKAFDIPEAKIADVAERRLSVWQRFDEEKIRYRIFLDAAFFAIAERDNVVTAGRGIASLVRGVSHALRVRIIAPFELRVERIMKKEGLDHAKAAHRIREYDRDVASRISYLFGPEWMLPENYDVVINTVRDDPALYANMVASMAVNPGFAPTPDSTQFVRNLSLAAQVRAAIAKDPHTQAALNVEVTADKGRVSLTGSVRHVSIRDAATSVAREVPGVVSVSSEQVEIAFYHAAAI
jgi:cytidylate kinase